MSRPLPEIAGLMLVALLVTACGTTVQSPARPTVDGALDAERPAAVGNGGVDGPVGTGGVSTPDLTAGRTGPAWGSRGGTTGRNRPAAAVVGPTASAVISDPIQIGFITTSMGNAESYGFNAGQSYPDRATYDALVAEYNAQGGVAGRRIVPVYGETDTASTDFSSQFAAICARFTEDNNVRVVIGYLFMFLPSFESCLARAQIPHFYGGYQPGDVGNQQQFPTLIGTGHPTVDGSLLTALGGALRSGLLTKSTKLGVMVNDCADGDRAYNRTAEPWLKAHRVNYRTVVLDCTEGAGEVSSMAAAVSNAQLRFASDGVNLVFAPGIELLVFMQAAQSQRYEPEYLGATGGAVIGANAPASQMRHFHGFGWMPSVDVDLQHQPHPQTAAQLACIAKLVKQGLRPRAYNDFMVAYETCDGIELYAKALAANRSTHATAVVSGVLAAMPSFVGAGTYGGSQQAAGSQRGGPAHYREYGWTDSCSCLTYRGGVFPVPHP